MTQGFIRTESSDFNNLTVRLKIPILTNYFVKLGRLDIAQSQCVGENEPMSSQRETRLCNLAIVAVLILMPTADLFRIGKSD